MRYRITHRTALRPTIRPAHESFNEVRLRPVSDRSTRPASISTLSIDPPASVITFMDYYGNAVHDFSVPYLHDRLRIEATSDVVTFADATSRSAVPARASLTGRRRWPAWSAEPQFADDHAEFLIPSTYVALEPAPAEIAQAFLAHRSRT